MCLLSTPVYILSNAEKRSKSKLQGQSLFTHSRLIRFALYEDANVSNFWPRQQYSDNEEKDKKK